MTSPCSRRSEIDVGHHVHPGADAAGNDVAVGVDPGLIGRQQSGIHLLLHVGVILGELLEAAVRGAGRPGCRRPGR